MTRGKLNISCLHSIHKSPRVVRLLQMNGERRSSLTSFILPAQIPLTERSERGKLLPRRRGANKERIRRKGAQSLQKRGLSNKQALATKQTVAHNKTTTFSQVWTRPTRLKYSSVRRPLFGIAPESFSSSNFQLKRRKINKRETARLRQPNERL